MSRLKITGLTKTYSNGLRALDNVSLSLGNGMFGLLGPNGAGKSSLMKILATLLLADQGEISFDGVSINKNPDFLRRQLGYLPQDFGVYPRVSAAVLLDHLAVLKGVSHSGDRKQQIQALLQQTNLYAHRNQAVSTFSGGMRQRFGIAQALLGNPQLLIVDEPTAGLDPQEKNRFHDMLSEIAGRIVVILSTHIIQDVYELCGEMAVLMGGQVLVGGKPAGLIQQLKGKVWQQTLSQEQWASQPAQPPVISTRLVGGHHLIRLFSSGPPPGGGQGVEPSLEDVYFSALAGLQPAKHQLRS